MVTNRELRDALNSMPESQLDDVFIIQGEEQVIRLSLIEALPEDYISPFDEGSDPRSIYLPGGDCYSEDLEFDPVTEPTSIPKGTIMFYQDL